MDAETASKPDSSDLPEETASPDKPQLKIESLEDLRRILVIAKGGDPNAQQTLNDFLQFDSNIERSNFPNTKTVLCITQLTGYSKLLYPDEENPFALIADSLSIAFMAKGGEKSKQFVEMMKQTPNLSDLQTIGVGEQQRSLTDRILGRSKPE